MSGTPYAPDHIVGALSRDPAVQAAVAAQKADDLRRFLSSRATELRPGGRMLNLSTGGLPDRWGWDWLCGWMWECVLEMGREGLLSADEQLRCTLPAGPRTLAEMEAPFATDGQFAGLTLDQVDVFPGPDPFWSVFEETGDAQVFGKTQSDWCRALGATSIAAAIEPDRDRGALVDAYFDRLAARLAADPQPHTFYAIIAVFKKLG